VKLAVWQMRGPVAPALAAIYRDTVELVMMETYFDLKDAWMIPFQLQTARLNGLLGKTIIGLGIGSESPDLGGHPWTQTKEELDQQLRLIRFVAPESPGVAFFGLDRLGKCPLSAEQLDRLCGRFLQIPTDGTGLKPELLALGITWFIETCASSSDRARSMMPARWSAFSWQMVVFVCTWTPASRRLPIPRTV